MAQYEVRLADLLYSRADSEEEKREASQLFYKRALTVTHSLDVFGALFVIFASCDFALDCAYGSIFVNAGYVLKSGTGVCLFMALSRIVIFPLLAYIAVKYGTETAHYSQNKSPHDSTSSQSIDETEDLLQERLMKHVAEVTSSENLERKRARRNANIVRYSALAGVFIASSVFQVYTGVKVTTYKWHHERIIELLSMCLSVLWINILAYLYRSYITDCVAEEGLYLKEVHRHPLFWTRGVILHRCDLCKERIQNKIGGCFRCKLCDYDICIKCAQRKDIANVGEDLIRTDKGVKMDETVSGGSYFTRAMSLAKPEAKLVSVSLVCLVLNCIANLALPSFQGHIINTLIENDKHEFSRNVRIYLIILLFQGLFQGLSAFLFNLVFRKLMFHVRNKLFASVIRQDIAFFDGTTSGTLTSKLTNDVIYMMNPIRNSFTTLLSNTILLIGGIFMCYYKSYKLSLIAFVTVGPIMFLWDLYGQYSKKLNRKLLAAWGTANSHATEALNHVRDVKSFGNEQHEADQYTEANNLALQAGIKDAIANGGTQMITGYLDLGTTVLILWMGGILVFQGALTVGELVAFQFYWTTMNNAYQGLQGLMVQFTQSAAAAEKVFQIWDNKPDIDADKGKSIDWPIKGEICVKNVSFVYQMRPDNQVLTDLSLTVPAGKVVALVGRSGGGKSTLIRLFLRFYDPKSGELTLDGRPYTSLKVSELRRNFGTVAQSTTLFAKSLLYNITYGLKPDEYTMEDVIAACKKAQCYDFIMSFKDQFETRAGESGVRISGGQGQRIAIARVFLRKPKIILLDEATSALDEESQKKVQDALDTLLEDKGSTVVLVAHRLSTVRNADKIAVIDKGVVLEEGSHEELLEVEDGVYRGLVNLKIASDKKLQDSGGSDETTKQLGVEELMEKVMKKKQKRDLEKDKDKENSKEKDEVNEVQSK